jgi:hypothetical protein
VLQSRGAAAAALYIATAMARNGSNATGVSDLFCGATLSGGVVTWNVTGSETLWSGNFFAPCASFVLLPAALFACALLLRLVGCLSRMGDDLGFGAPVKGVAAAPRALDVEYCATDNFRYWGAVMVLVSWPVLIAHGQLNKVGSTALLGDESLGSALVFFAVAFMVGDQVLDVKLRWRAHKRQHPKAEAGCVSPTSFRHVLFWILAVLAIGTPLLGYYESDAPFSADFQFWSLAIRTALAVFTLACNAAAGRYLTTGTDILRLPTTAGRRSSGRRNQSGGASASAADRSAATARGGGELRDPLLAAGDVNNDEEEEAGGEVAARRSPEEDANFVSQGWFSWLNPIMKVGARRPLVHEDLYPVHPTDNCEACQVRMLGGSG